MVVLDYYDLLIGILLLIAGVISAKKSKHLNDIPEENGNYSQKIMAQKFSIALIFFGFSIIIYAILKK